MIFSIIIPVYQVEKYLEQCLESVLNQNFEDYEVILIDDGSTDNSGKICDDYASKYSNVEVIHQTNSGISVARNNGMERANGDYIVFIDSDDYIASNSLEYITFELKRSRFPDLLITRYIRFTTSGEIYYPDLFLKEHEISKMSKEKLIRILFNHTENIGAACRYITKRVFLEKYAIRFPEGFIHEDIEWTIRLFLFADTFSRLKSDWYYYRTDRQDSITNNIQLQNYVDIFTLFARNIQYTQSNCDNDSILDIITQRILKDYIDLLLLKYKNFGNTDKRKIDNLFKKHKYFFRKSNSVKYKLLASFTDLFGLDFSLKLYWMIIRLKKWLREKQQIG